MAVQWTLGGLNFALFWYFKNNHTEIGRHDKKCVSTVSQNFKNVPFCAFPSERCKNTSLTPAKFSLKNSMWVSKNAENVMLLSNSLRPVGNIPLFLLVAPISSDVSSFTWPRQFQQKLINKSLLNSNCAGAHSNLVTHDVSTLFSVQQGETQDRVKVHYKTPSGCNIWNLI